MNEEKKAESRLRTVFESWKSEEGKESLDTRNLSPEIKDKIVAAFLALEDLLIEAFPNSRLVAQVLTFLEIAAMYVTRLF